MNKTAEAQSKCGERRDVAFLCALCVKPPRLCGYTFAAKQPPLAVQREIVEKIEKERETVDKCRELVVLYEGKVKKAMEWMWE